MGKPIILFLTGIPGAGKTSLAAQLTKQATELRASVHFINDYPLLEQWAEMHRGDESRVSWTEDNVFSINPRAYPEASLYIAQEIAREIQLHEIPQDIFVIESARGAGENGHRDRYDKHLFAPFVENEAILEAFRLMNIEVVVNNVNKVVERVRHRFAENPNSAPPFVVEKYIGPGGVMSAQEQASHYDAFALNEVINNSGSPEDAQRQMAALLAFLLADLGNEYQQRPEGQRPSGHEWE